ncbi:MAG: HAMP domain-containing histidine kinase [Sphaerochaetaceae bacterium]|nr:HAMP domain-containing histidine kinase [Sphaerochaetaceae bacterium]
MKRYFWRNFILIFSVAVITLGVQLGILIIQYRSSRGDWVDSVYSDFVGKVDSKLEYSGEARSEVDLVYDYIESLDDNRISMYRVYDSEGNEVQTIRRNPEFNNSLSHEEPQSRPSLSTPPSISEPSGGPPSLPDSAAPSMDHGAPANEDPLSSVDGDFVGAFELEVGENEVYTVQLYSYNPATYTYTKDLVNSFIRSVLISVPVCLVIAVILSLLVSRNNTATVNEVRTALNDLASGKNTVKLKRARKTEMEDIAIDIENLGKTLESNERSRKAWLTSISHDLNTPATGIKIIADALSDGIFPPDTETLNSLKHESDNLNSRISKVVDYSTLQEKKITLSRISFCDFATRMASLFSESIAVECAEGEMCADIPLMEKACRELLSNAFSFGCDVALSVGKDSGNYYIRVTNTGKLPEAVAGEVLFEPWSRADSSRHEGGTGLGLPIVGTIAMLHGGTANIAAVSDSKVCASILWPVK